MVGEGEFHVFARAFDVGKVDIIPACGVSSYLSTLVPIEVDKVLAQARVGSSVLHVKTEVDSLIRSDLKINLSSVYLVVHLLEASQLINESANDIRSYNAQVQTSRDWESDGSTSGVLAINYSADGNVSSLATLVSQINV